ncbi:LysM peptidoglycan-binding domain-containing protein [Methyloversatilis sp. XJ19-13]|uniref:FimV/HubP family polar landmark protein n=1 Tax=Methyloversatilis sp. XJ19-13 TaxID=2963430 RepID=UPI00211CAB88|nr:LysM peptidoglycan-binding domain-containing protein [Methyloversatilis sp. XJ19-13]
MRHSDKKHSIRLLTALLSALPLTAGAAGLGKLTVQSAIGQALRAEVELSASADELASMTARLAPPSAFKQAGVEYATSLSGVKVAVEKRGSRPVLVVTSERVVNEPYLDVLIELNWSSGKLVREYTFLLDPADMPRQAPVDPVVVKSAEPRAVTRVPAAPTRAPADNSYEVKRGDTLSRIAGEYVPAGVSLDQMLVALVQANPEAFDNGNMNRLRAGRILAIPDQSAAQAVSPQEARKIVMAQTSDFAAYRARLAGAVADSTSAADTGSRAASGRIEAQVDDRAPSAAAASDQVRVSKSAAESDRKISALEEEVVAKERALKDANSRLADLERNVRELQKLVELKNTPMAQAQQQAATPPAPTPAPAPAPAVAPSEKPVPDLAADAAKPEEKAVPDLVALADEKPAEKPAEPPAAVEPPSAEPAPPVAAPVPAPEPEPAVEPEQPGLFSDPKTLGGLGAVLLLVLGYLGYRKSKARQAVPDATPSTTAGLEAAPAASSVIGATGGGQSVDTSASSIQTDFSQSSLSSIDADEGVDPVAEADVYMAYGRDAQAEEILLEALKTEPSRHAIHLKLLEIYAQRKSVKPFETMATELYAQTGGRGADWEKAALLGRSVDPTNPLYGGGDAPDDGFDEQASMAATVVVSGADKMRDTWTLPGDIGLLASGSEPTIALDLNKLDLGAPEVPAAKADADLDFDLDIQSSEPLPEAPAVGVATTMTKPGEESDADSSLDFDLGLDFTSDESRKDVSTVVLEKNVADTAESLAQSSQGFDLDLSLPAAGDADPDAAASGAVVDLERTDVGNLIDFNFDASDAPAQAAAEPVIDLSDINLDLGTDPSTLETDIVGDPLHALETDVVGDAVQAFDEPPPQALPDLSESSVSTVINPEDMLATEEPPQTAAEEAETKLELARAYEEMGDKEGARELLQEVVREGTADQQSQASEMLAKLA